MRLVETSNLKHPGMKNKVEDRFFGDLYEISFYGIWMGYWDEFLGITSKITCGLYATKWGTFQKVKVPPC